MKRAFDKDSQEHLGCDGGPPGYDDGSFLRQWGLHKNSTAFKIMYDGKPIGAVILFIQDDNHNALGNIFIDSDLQSKGLGIRVWNQIEKMYPKTVEWRTETAGFSRGNHSFYVNKCGFHITKIVNPRDEKESSYFFRKQMKK